MNPMELRYLIYRLLGDDSTEPARLSSLMLVPPVPGGPLAIDVVAPDPYSSDPDAVRTYRIQIVEV